MNTNGLMMENYALDPRSEEDIWSFTDFTEEERWEATSDSVGSIRSTVSDSDDDGSIPTIETRIQSNKTHSSTERSLSHFDNKSKASSVYTGDSAYGSPIHQNEMDTHISTTYCSSKPISFIRPNINEDDIKSGPSCVGRQCHVCDTTFIDTEEYQVHVRTHERLKKMQCPFCSVLHLNGDDFFNHVKTHSSVGQQCSVCLKRFKLPNSLADHQKLHNRWRKCPFYSCKKVFRTDESYRQHLKTHDIYGEEVNMVTNHPPKRKLSSSCSSYSDDGISEKITSYEDDSDEEQFTVKEVYEDENEVNTSRTERALVLSQPLNKKFHIDKSMKLTIKKTIHLPTKRPESEFHKSKKRIKPLI